MKKTQLILASKSPRRAAILKQIEISFQQVESNYEEKVGTSKATQQEVIELAIGNARGKARDVAEKINQGVVLGVDTLVLCKGKILGKPKDAEDAFRMLQFINNAMHIVVSGIVLIEKTTNNTKEVSDHAVANVYFRNASDKELRAYVATGEPLDKAGGYGEQERGARFIERIDGDFYTIVGLPVVKLLMLAKKLGVDL